MNVNLTNLALPVEYGITIYPSVYVLPILSGIPNSALNAAMDSNMAALVVVSVLLEASMTVKLAKAYKLINVKMFPIQNGMELIVFAIQVLVQ
jgi:hypothetical protein